MVSQNNKYPTYTCTMESSGNAQDDYYYCQRYLYHFIPSLL